MGNHHFHNILSVYINYSLAITYARPSPKDEETVSKRIQVYLDETKPLVDYYSSQGIIANINGQQSIDKVFEDIVTALGSDK
mgnify:CR=1 FL=1